MSLLVSSAHDGLTQQIHEDDLQQQPQQSDGNDNDDLRLDVSVMGGFLDESPTSGSPQSPPPPAEAQQSPPQQPAPVISHNANWRSTIPSQSTSSSSDKQSSGTTFSIRVPPPHAGSRVMGTDKQPSPAGNGIARRTSAKDNNEPSREFDFGNDIEEKPPVTTTIPKKSRESNTNKPSGTFLGKTLEEDDHNSEPRAAVQPAAVAARSKTTAKPGTTSNKKNGTKTSTTTTTAVRPAPKETPIPPVPTIPTNNEQIPAKIEEDPTISAKELERQEKALKRQYERDLKESLSIDDEDLWNFMWPWMKLNGWTHRPGSGLFVDWYYLAPGVKTVSDGVKGETLLDSTKTVAAWVREHSPEILHHALEDYHTRFAAKKKPTISKSSSSSSNNSKQGPLRLEDIAKFDPLWKWLKTQGWIHKTGRGLVTWYYVVPGHEKRGGKRGVDYLHNEDKLYEFLAHHKEYLKGYILDDGRDLSEVDFIVPPLSSGSFEDDVSPAPKRARKSTSTISGASGGDVGATTTTTTTTREEEDEEMEEQPPPPPTTSKSTISASVTKKQPIKKTPDDDLPPKSSPMVSPTSKNVAKSMVRSALTPSPSKNTNVKRAHTFAPTTTTATAASSSITYNTLPTSPRAFNSSLLKGKTFTLAGFDEQSHAGGAPPLSMMENMLKQCGATVLMGTVASFVDVSGIMPDFITIARPVGYRTEKFLLAASQSKPCLHFRWVIDSMQAGSLRRVDDYVLPRGPLLPCPPNSYSTTATTLTTSGILSPSKTQHYKLSNQYHTFTLNPPRSSTPFADWHFFVLGSKGFQIAWKFCLVNMGASKVEVYTAGASIPDGCVCLFDTENATDNELTKELITRAQRHPSIITATPAWATQCVMTGTAIPLRSNKAFYALPTSASRPDAHLPPFFVQRKVPKSLHGQCLGSAPQSTRPVEILGEVKTEGNRVMTEMIRLGFKRYEVGDFIFVRHGRMTHDMFYLSGIENGPREENYRFGQIISLYVDSRNGVPRVIWRLLFREPSSQILSDTGEVMDTPMDMMDGKFMCVVVQGEEEAVRVMSNKAIFQSSAVDFRERVYVMAVVG